MPQTERTSEDQEFAQFVVEDWNNMHPKHKKRALVSLRIKYDGYAKDFTKEQARKLILA